MKKIIQFTLAGTASLSIYLLSIQIPTIQNYILSEIINTPFLILSIPLYIIYATLGFALDIIFNTGIGYESLSIFPAGKIFIQITSYIYYILIGFFILWATQNRKKSHKTI